MDGHIDWLSFTLPTDLEIDSLRTLATASHSQLRNLGEWHHDTFYNGQGLDNGVGRAPYRYSLVRADGGARIYGGGSIRSILYELTGRGCEVLRDPDLARAMVTAISERITRMDYAVDVRSDVRPAVFANDRKHQNFRAISYIKSDTGETVYIGSPKSDRFARVYRYDKPHPRAELLRIEYVFRRDLAKASAHAFLTAASEQTFIAQLGNTWGFNHPVWEPGAVTDERLRAPIVSREEQDTVRWLYVQVAPALRRLIDHHAINVNDWWEYVLRGDDDASSEAVTG